MLNISPISANLHSNSSVEQKSAKSFPATEQKTVSCEASSILAQQNKAMINFKGIFSSIGLPKTPAGSQDKNLKKLLEEAKLGNGFPLIMYLRGGQVSSNPETKKAIEKTFNGIPEEDGGAIDDLKEALEVIAEKMQGKS
ncbi:MAG: hypothetical protein PHC34_11065 [Candidatus Gastranaerophilales bacterium]|nr:hypothetical protein [Candidatus Gastranaerophilales bacterium]